MALPDKCPLCNASRLHQNVITSHVYGGGLGKKNHAFFHCLSCDVRYQYPGLDPEEEAHFYAKEFEGFMEGRAGIKGGWQKAEDHINANEATRIRRMKYLEQHIQPTSSILEVGCSSGFMLYPLKKDGHICHGVEPSGVFRDYIQSQGMLVHESLPALKKSFPEIRYDIIMHFFVLEHISQPVDFIKTTMQLLKPGGKIIFEIPNAADPLYSVYDIPAFERFYWSIAHPWYFSKQSLEYVLNKTGKPYEIILDQRYDLSNHLVWARDGKPGGLGKYTNLIGQEIEDTYRQNLVKKGLCDTLIGVISNE